MRRLRLSQREIFFVMRDAARRRVGLFVLRQDRGHADKDGLLRRQRRQGRGAVVLAVHRLRKALLRQHPLSVRLQVPLCPGGREHRGQEYADQRQQGAPRVQQLGRVSPQVYRKARLQKLLDLSRRRVVRAGLPQRHVHRLRRGEPQHLRVRRHSVHARRRERAGRARLQVVQRLLS